MESKVETAHHEGRRSIIAKLACWIGGHNASDNSWGQLHLAVDPLDDDAVSQYLYETISATAKKPLEEEIIKLKAMLFDLQNRNSKSKKPATPQ